MAKKKYSKKKLDFILYTYVQKALSDINDTTTDSCDVVNCEILSNSISYKLSRPNKKLSDMELSMIRAIKS